MCGLAGAYTQIGTVLTKKQRLRRARALEALLIANAARGTDATGVVTVCGDKRCVYKRAVASYQFVAHKGARALLRSDDPLIIAHTRFGTTGGNTDENAHPFEEGNVVGTHNGVISNYTALDKAVRDGRQSEEYDYVAVDSQAVFRILDYVGPENYIKGLEQVRGSAALVWHDKRNPDALWMMAHSNPINLAWVKSSNTLFWSSQYDHLSSVMWGTFGNDWQTVKIKDDVLYLFDGRDLTKPEGWPVTMPLPYTYNYSRHGSSVYPYGSGWIDDDDDDDDIDRDVKHPYATTTVSRKALPYSGHGKDEDKGKEVAGHVRAIHGMGLAWPVDDLGESDSASSTPDEDDEGITELESTCSVCLGSLDDGALPAKFSQTTWVCEGCVKFWEGDGMDVDNILASMGH